MQILEKWMSKLSCHVNIIVDVHVTTTLNFPNTCKSSLGKVANFGLHDFEVIQFFSEGSPPCLNRVKLHMVCYCGTQGQGMSSLSLPRPLAML